MIRPAFATSEILAPFARDVHEGLSKKPKSIPSSYFYDQRGSELFEQITTLDEYYLTRCEREILRTRGAAIARQLPKQPYRLIELGAGDGHKTQILLEQLVAQRQRIEYVPIDICGPSVERLVAQLRESWDAAQLSVHGIEADYLEALASLRMSASKPNVVLFLGSSIGNMTARQACNFLAQARLLLNPGDLVLLGFDLQKPIDILLAAYDDRHGVTREFNFNLLDRINRDLAGEFCREDFTHYARYNFRRDCMESWLVSRRKQRVTIHQLRFAAQFETGEGMLLERSHKYNRRGIERLAQRAGYVVRQHFVDAQRYFVDSLWQVPAGPST